LNRSYSCSTTNICAHVSVEFAGDGQHPSKQNGIGERWERENEKTRHNEENRERTLGTVTTTVPMSPGMGLYFSNMDWFGTFLVPDDVVPTEHFAYAKATKQLHPPNRHSTHIFVCRLGRLPY